MSDVPRATLLLASTALSLCVGLTMGSAGAPRGERDSLSADPLQAGSLCARTEKIVFSCTLKPAAKIVSLCSSKHLTKTRGYLQYRFGLPGKVELEFPKQRERSQEAFKYSHYFRALVDRNAISFTSDGYEYVVFSDYEGDIKPVILSQGVYVTPPNNGKEVQLNCRGQAKANFGDLEDALLTVSPFDYVPPTWLH